MPALYAKDRALQLRAVQRMDLVADDLQKGGFSRSIGSDDSKMLPLIDRERDIVEDRSSSTAYSCVFDLDNRMAAHGGAIVA